MKSGEITHGEEYGRKIERKRGMGRGRGKREAHTSIQLESAVRKSDSYQPTEGAFDVTKLLDAKGITHTLT